MYGEVVKLNFCRVTLQYNGCGYSNTDVSVLTSFDVIPSPFFRYSKYFFYLCFIMEPINPKLKKIIFDKISKDLSHAEIILEDKSETIWFIDRENKYWYLEFEKSGDLWWRYQFFDEFFKLFSMEQSEYEPIIGEWVEDVLNRKVVSTSCGSFSHSDMVEDVLNRKVVSMDMSSRSHDSKVEYALNQKITPTKKNDEQ